MQPLNRSPRCSRVFLIWVLASVPALAQWTPLPVANDPLLRMPGTQPGVVSLEGTANCLSCHGDFDPVTAPGDAWQGSMMGAAARDFLFWASVTVAAQDSIWAIGRPNATDLCLRCHSPPGWLEGRSDPTNGSLLTGEDFDGVSCSFCHKTHDPFFEDTFAGTREGSDWLNYWDETNASLTPSLAAAAVTLSEDEDEADLATLFNGNPFYQSDLPHAAAYDENGGGQYFVASSRDKRASFADAGAKHSMLYSRYHKSKYFCSTCHDVSNPVLHNLAFEGTAPGDGTTVLPSEEAPAYSYFHVERTFSEFMASAYGAPGGAAGLGPFAPDVFPTQRSNDFIASCQDCHMRDVPGKACDKSSAVDRPAGSVEHPNSGVPRHGFAGGNLWVPTVLASAVPGSPNHDPVNQALLAQGPAVLTLDLSQGQGLDPAALLAVAAETRRMLEDAASIEALSFHLPTRTLRFRVQNQTGHKLISGFPEGRRMFVNVRAYARGRLVHEVNPYDATAGTLKGLGTSGSPPLGPAESHRDDLVYEEHSDSSLTGEARTFHMALATGRHKDNRIPPLGFDVTEAVRRLCEPVWNGQSDPGYFTAAEYAGGYDEVTLVLPVGFDTVDVTLYYQTTSREYVEFLRDEILGVNGTLPPGAYVIQTDPWFDQLRAWGETIWQLWEHNKDLPGAAPVPMTGLRRRVAVAPFQTGGLSGK